MPLWGRNDQAVTANATTTNESSTGAPIGTWALVKGSGNGDTPISMDSNAHFGNTSAGSRASVDVALFDNTTPGAFISKMATGVFGVSATEMSNNVINNSNERPAHAGWVFRRAGTGPITSLTISGNGSVQNSFANADTIIIASPEAGGNAAATLVTNSEGSIVTVTITNPGYGFTAVDNSANVVISTDTGTNSSVILTATAGGRAGRVMTETLVAMGSLGAQTASYGTPASVADASTDNTEYPGT